MLLSLEEYYYHTAVSGSAVLCLTSPGRRSAALVRSIVFVLWARSIANLTLSKLALWVNNSGRLHNLDNFEIGIYISGLICRRSYCFYQKIGNWRKLKRCCLNLGMAGIITALNSSYVKHNSGRTEARFPRAASCPI